MRYRKRTYLGNIWHSFWSVMGGMRISGKHLRRGWKYEPPRGVQEEGYFAPNQGVITVEYPLSKIPVPENGRYRLHLETEDCIACDKCARICPVDCITIDSFKAAEELGQTSDGTTKRLHLPVFDIDMAKCMFCGLCTTVCPTECLTMTPAYDFSEVDRDNLTYHFGAMSPEEEAVVRAETEEKLAAQKAAKAAAAAPKTEAPAESAAQSGGFMPRRKPVISAESNPETSAAPPVAENTDESTEQKAFAPKRKPVMKPAETPAEPTPDQVEETPKTFAPKRKPIMASPPVEKEQENPTISEENKEEKGKEEDKPAFTPRRKPIMKRSEEEENREGGDNAAD